VQTVVRDLFTAATAADIISSDAFGALVYRLSEHCSAFGTTPRAIFNQAINPMDLTYCSNADNAAAFLAAKVRDLS
jgi:hypothetical protein